MVLSIPTVSPTSPSNHNPSIQIPTSVLLDESDVLDNDLIAKIRAVVDRGIVSSKEYALVLKNRPASKSDGTVLFFHWLCEDYDEGR
jgi:hypothetical protein